ncbi:DgyrCDS13706 [Dimorphilus gyrociliatus]|uniref:DgyrCDS13706 n=1 Tax=Dimorphilus gyrociliatus TaxID=2664684 RepID=A0A7I8WBI6_9ANNE|nr:DgyrCDS13706 [Dimorphilus gyrociliatus]
MECLLLKLSEKMNLQVPEVNLSVLPYGIDEESINLEYFSEDEFYVTVEKKRLEKFFRPIFRSFQPYFLEKRDSFSSLRIIDGSKRKKNSTETYIFSPKKLFDEIQIDTSISEVLIRTSTSTQKFDMKKNVAIRLAKWPKLCRKWLQTASKLLPQNLYADILNCGILLSNSEVQALTWKICFDEISIKLLNYFSISHPNLIKAYTIVLLTIHQKYKEDRQDKLAKNLRQQLRTVVFNLAFNLDHSGSIEENSIIILDKYARYLKEKNLVSFFMDNVDLLKIYQEKDIEICLETIQKVKHCFAYYILKRREEAGASYQFLRMLPAVITKVFVFLLLASLALSESTDIGDVLKKCDLEDIKDALDVCSECSSYLHACFQIDCGQDLSHNQTCILEHVKIAAINDKDCSICVSLQYKLDSGCYKLVIEESLGNDNYWTNYEDYEDQSSGYNCGIFEPQNDVDKKKRKRDNKNNFMSHKIVLYILVSVTSLLFVASLVLWWRKTSNYDGYETTRV